MTQPPPYGHGKSQQVLTHGQSQYPIPGPPATAGRWWQHPGFIIAALVVFPPGGVALTWLSRWSQPKKITATVLACLWFITPFLGDRPEESKATSGPTAPAPAAAPADPSANSEPAGPPSFVGQNLKVAKDAARTAGYSASSHDASNGDAGQWADSSWKVCLQNVSGKKIDFGVVRNEQPCPANDGEPIPYPKMPKVIGLTLGKASETLAPLALQKVNASSAYTDVTLPAAADDWTVCFQDPQEGKEIKDPKSTAARLKVTAPGTACPATEYTQLHPDPAPPTTDDSDSSSSSGGSSSSDGSSSGGGGSVYYKNCDAVRAAGRAPLHQGDPGYSKKLDRDGDGVACE
ncbi:excalibur calcium-binding domain-containing protein [Kitasatospora griseola]|uniref:excalibur calcium-binding domain-containing protein n=1 Tax=Kitasatospora griseola TaxID=2064 RepID=UPI0019994BB7|nr:excalibur calcium-binding domain-containing protein [Kitasatospora griseola]GGQ64389.1 hypothetical protein GCM10010195_19920 [Kitasatospora griseola]